MLIVRFIEVFFKYCFLGFLFYFQSCLLLLTLTGRRRRYWKRSESCETKWV